MVVLHVWCSGVATCYNMLGTQFIPPLDLTVTTHAFAAAAEGYRRFIPFILMEKRTVVFDSSEYCSGFGFKKDTWCLWIVIDSTYVLWNASVAMGKHILYQYIILYHHISPNRKTHYSLSPYVTDRLVCFHCLFLRLLMTCQSSGMIQWTHIDWWCSGRGNLSNLQIPNVLMLTLDRWIGR